MSDLVCVPRWSKSPRRSAEKVEVKSSSFVEPPLWFTRRWLTARRLMSAELIKVGKVVPGEHSVIGRVGLAAHADAPAPDIATTEAFKRALLNADALIFNNVASGN
jgi:hypothetical protein